MLFSRKPYQIDSVYYMDNTLKIGCDCQAFSETLTGCKDCFKDAKGRITVSAKQGSARKYLRSGSSTAVPSF